MIRLAFRLDDPSATSNQEIEARILGSLARHGLRATFAVIPFRGTMQAPMPLTRERARAMREAVAHGVLDVALHGHSHLDADMGGHPSEFAGVPAGRQRELIAAGKALLESVFEKPVTGFVPPWNSFDAATLDALEQLGFDHLSSNLAHAPMRPPRLRMLPLTCHLPMLEAAIAEARRFARLEPVVTVVMHHYDFPGGDKPVFRGHDEFDSLLAWVAGQADVHVKTLNELAEELTPAASQRGFSHLRLRARLPWRFRHWLPDLCVATRPLP
ncbi:MAG: polysaccharide deacetylase family protein [Gammaproteobacteria bacterium]|nr:polysaccharide deacetylase family protein [Gammaproteobacteria bacterium]